MYGKHLPLSYPQPLFLLFILIQEVTELSRLALNLWSFCLIFSSSWDYQPQAQPDEEKYLYPIIWAE